MIEDRPKMATSSPCHLPRSAGGRISPMMDMAMGIIAPAPSPWMARKKISSVIVWLAPARAEPSRKMTMPTMKKGLRP